MHDQNGDHRITEQVRVHRLEAFTFFFAMMLAVVLEGAGVYWCGDTLAWTMRQPCNFVGQWTGFTLRQGWLLGALLVLIAV